MRITPLSALLLAISLCTTAATAETPRATELMGVGPNPTLPKPEKSLMPTVNTAKAVGWPANGKPQPAQGLAVNAFANELVHPRWIYVLPNGDVLVAETNAPPRPEEGKGVKGWFMKQTMKKAGAAAQSANRITLLRDADGDGVAELKQPFLENLNSPFGMALVGNDFYVANADSLWRFPYRPGDTRISAPGTKVCDLPGGPLNHHWTKSLVASRDGSRLYVGVGSNSNIGENGMEAENGRAAIWEIDPRTGRHRVFASGLRNPVGMDWEPRTGQLWVVVNERDELGNDLVPDYLTSVVDKGFYGWPWSYYGPHVDERVKPQRPDLVATALKPDYALGSHVAALGLTLGEPAALPAPFSQGGAFIGEHGSWNRKPFSGYRVVFVPFANGKPSDDPIEVLGGFLNDQGEAQGRPVGVAVDRRGALLVADDVGNTVWRVSGNGAR
jgi:glucose/arabinose dehydrogenase